MAYKVFIDPKAIDYLKKLDKKTSEQILNSVEKLKERPEYFGKPLTGIDLWELRVGDYRVLFELDRQSSEVRIVNIGHRKSIYKGIG